MIGYSRNVTGITVRRVTREASSDENGEGMRLSQKGGLHKSDGGKGGRGG